MGSRLSYWQPHYMAPEQYTRGVEYSHYVDFWAAAVMHHEMLTGEPPAGQVLTGQAPEVLRGVGFIDEVTADLLQRMLTVDRSQRLGCGDTGLSDIMAHPYFAGVDWERLERKEVPGPLLDSRGANFRQLGKDDVAGARTISTRHPATFTAALDHVSEASEASDGHEGRDGREGRVAVAFDTAFKSAISLANSSTCHARHEVMPLSTAPTALQGAAGLSSSELRAAPVGTEETTMASSEQGSVKSLKVD